MKRIKTFVGMLCAAAFVMGGLLSTSCKKDENPTPEVKDETITIEISAEATATTVTFTGSVTKGADAPKEVTFGIVYSKEEADLENATPVEIDLNDDNTFSKTISDLEEGTTYFYKAFSVVGEESPSYTEQASITTPYIIPEVESIDKQGVHVTFWIANIPFYQNMGIVYGLFEKRELIDEKTLTIVNDETCWDAEKNKWKLQITKDLVPSTKYYYKEFRGEHFNEEKSFTTDDMGYDVSATVTGTSVKFVCDVDDNTTYGPLPFKYGVIYSTSESLDNATDVNATFNLLDAIGWPASYHADVTVSDLPAGKYYYKAYYKATVKTGVDENKVAIYEETGGEFYTDIKSFTIE